LDTLGIHEMISINVCDNLNSNQKWEYLVAAGIDNNVWILQNGNNRIILVIVYWFPKSKIKTT
jgi:hypothetical protein